MKVILCECVHEYQDKRYGKGKRIANECKNGGFRCTCCGKNASSGVDGKRK